MHDVNDRWRAARERLKGWKERFLHQVGAAHPAAWLTLAAAFMFAVVFGNLGVQNHRNFGTWSYDMGIYDQAIWLMSRGQSFMSVRGMNVWGHHFNPVLLLFAPFYWFGAGPEFLYVVQACALAAAAVPIYLIARDKFKTPVDGSALCCRVPDVRPSPMDQLGDVSPRSPSDRAVAVRLVVRDEAAMGLVLCNGAPRTEHP